MSKEKLDRGQVLAELGVAFREYQQANENYDRAVAELVGINTTDARCMDFLHQHGRMTAGELAERSSLSPGAVTTVIDRMERAGLARRVRDDGDRRRVMVELTDAATQKTMGIMAPFLAEADTIVDKYSTEELAAVARFLGEARDLSNKWAAKYRERPAADPAWRTPLF